MRARILRGAAEIGGTCVELSADGKRLVLDLGLPLDSSSREVPPLPNISGLERADESLLGVIVSHPHADHYGLVPEMHKSVPLFIGETAEAILRESAFFTRAPALPEASGYLAHGVPLRLGPFRVTPYLVDHSAFDSYALLVEVAGRRLLYSGDLRAHGRKPGTFELLVRQPPSDVDVLLLEGTRVGREPDQGLAGEQEVEDHCAERFSQTNGLALALYSPQNVDRLVTVFKAARRAGRELVLDLYAASVAAATARATIPQPGFDGIRVYVPQRQRFLVKDAGAFDRVNRIRACRIYAEELSADPSRYVLTFRQSMGDELARRKLLQGARATWMMWPGYLSMDRGRSLLPWLERERIEMDVAHASGHASLADLKRLADAVDAKRLVPIHTGAPELFDEHFPRVRRQPDGLWWEV